MRKQTSADNSATQPLCPAIVGAIEGICDDPVFRALEKRKPKKYALVWIVSLNRPIITFDDPKEGYVMLYTRKELAVADGSDFCETKRWPEADVEIRRHTLIEALSIVRGLPTPVTLVRRLGVCKKITGVCVEGVRSERFYPL